MMDGTQHTLQRAAIGGRPRRLRADSQKL